MNINDFSLILGFGVAWFWAKSHYTDQFKSDMDDKIKELASTSSKELSENIQKAKDAFLKANGTPLDFKSLYQIRKDPAGSWYLHYIKIREYHRILEENGWKKLD